MTEDEVHFFPPVSPSPAKVLLVKRNEGALALNPLELVFRDTRLPYYSLYDMLGWYLSVVGETPADANRENYYKPLLFLYTMWCMKTAGLAKVPRTTQITWLDAAPPAPKLVHLALGMLDGDTELDENIRVALGASIAASTLVKHTVRLARYDLLKEHIPEVPPEEVSLLEPPAQKFGHCAETLPFLMIIK